MRKQARKLLGLLLDRKINFIDHASIYKKVSETVRRLGYILPNLRRARERRKRLLATVATSKIYITLHAGKQK